MIQESGILEKHGLAVHSELRPFDFEKRQAIHGEKWRKIKQVNHAASIDLVLVDTSKKYWKQAYHYILKKQSTNRKKKCLRYWRFLVYPLKAFKAVIEFKIRVQGNKKRIMKDIDKLILINERIECSLKYLIILDRKASDRDLDTILNYRKSERKCSNIHIMTE